MPEHSVHGKMGCRALFSSSRNVRGSGGGGGGKPEETREREKRGRNEKIVLLVKQATDRGSEEMEGQEMEERKGTVRQRTD